MSVRLKKYRPITPGQRHKVTVNRKPVVHDGAPEKSLTSGVKRSAGRNSAGRMTVRGRGGGTKKKIRTVDFKRSDKDGIPAKVEHIEYDPNRSAYLALVVYADGERRYMVAAKGVKAGDVLMSGVDAPIKPGNCLPLENIPQGTVIHCLELKIGKGAQCVRSAGTSAQLVAKEGESVGASGYVIIRMRSGEMRKVLSKCRACIGEVSNSDHALQKLGKAGANRWRGRRPKVRGVAMNPVDHPHGGGEGKTSGGRHPVSKQGVPAKGYKTRAKGHRTNKMIVRSRSKNQKRSD
jgi:large subunit ribosomal protein L2